MAIVSSTNVKSGQRFRTFRWANITNGNSGDAYELPTMPDKTVTFTGTFGAGGSVTMYGSNNEADVGVEPGSGTWVALVDPQGNPITKTGAAIEVILDCPRFICPRVTAGDGTTSITVTVTASREV